MRLHHFPRAGNSLGDARFVEWLQNVIHGIHIERLHRKLVKRGGKNHVRHFHLGRDDFFQHTETIETGHFYIQKHKVRGMFLDQRNGFDAVLPLPNHIDVRKAFQQERQFFPCRLLVIHNDGVYGHVWRV